MIELTRKRLCWERSNENQNGFQRRKSAPLALRKILRSVQTVPGKHVMCLSIDKSGAFDSVWYDLVIALAADAGWPKPIVRLIKAYLTDRYVFMDQPGIRIGKTATLGAPQGSFLGPYLWNLPPDALFRHDIPDGCELICYADDCKFVVSADTRDLLLQKSQECLDSF